MHFTSFSSIIIGNIIILEAMVLTSPNLDLPMLYGYALGEMISCHDGVRCYPASRRDTDQAYILKVISIPASRSKLMLSATQKNL